MVGHPARALARIPVGMPDRVLPPRTSRNWTRPGKLSSTEPAAESLPFEAHLEAYRRIFGSRQSEDGPPIVWTPDETTVRRSNLQASMEAMGMGDYADFHAWSVRDRPAFWAHTLKQLGIVFTRPPDAMLDLAGGVRRPQWAAGCGIEHRRQLFHHRSQPTGGHHALIRWKHALRHDLRGTGAPRKPACQRSRRPGPGSR